MASATPNYATSGLQFNSPPDFSKLETRSRLSQAAVDGYIKIVERWGLSVEQQGELLGGLSRAMIYRLRTAAGTRTVDELTRISLVIGIYKALHILLPDEAIADRWMTSPNDNPLFGGAPPLDFALQSLVQLSQIRRLLDAARGGQ